MLSKAKTLRLRFLADMWLPAVAVAMVVLLCGIGALAPTIITTWDLPEASKTALEVLEKHGSAVDAVVEGCSYCERNQCRMTVGYGGSPDESGETTLDALVMDGTTMDVGAVGGLKNIKEAISVASHVLRHTEHSLVVGELATKFAVAMGFNETSLTTNYSTNLWKDWKRNKCQPNFWKNVKPNPKEYCGPYTPLERKSDDDDDNRNNHDTIGTVALDLHGNIAAGTSTNGLSYKIQGRVGDSPIVGSGGYADSAVGGAAATGNGDILMRFMPSFHVVLLMESGMKPGVAAEFVSRRISKRFPDGYGAIVAMSVTGEFGAGCFGYDYFPYTAANGSTKGVQSFNVTCV